MRVALLLRTFVLFCVRAMLRCYGVLSCFGCFVTDIHGIGPTCLLLLFCEYLCVRACLEREEEQRARAMSRRVGQLPNGSVGR